MGRSLTRTRKWSRTATPWSPVGQTSTPHTQSYQHPLLHRNRKPTEGVSDACNRLQVDWICTTHMTAFVCYVSLCCDVLAHCRSHDSQSKDTVSVDCINVSTCTRLIQYRDSMVSCTFHGVFQTVVNSHELLQVHLMCNNHQLKTRKPACL